MTCVSSFRPLGESPEIAKNQLFAKQSWEQTFDRIIYFGEYEEKLASPKTIFIGSEQFPTLDRMLTAASLSDDWSCLINADIVVSNTLGTVVLECIRRNIQAITSKRYQFENEDLQKAKVVDSGYDFFMTDAKLWLGAAQNVPPGYRIGHNRWDNWVLGWLRVMCGKHFVDVTSRRLIFHPRHGGRKQPHHIDVPNDKFIQNGIPPLYRLR